MKKITSTIPTHYYISRRSTPIQISQSRKLSEQHSSIISLINKTPKKYLNTKLTAPMTAERKKNILKNKENLTHLTNSTHNEKQGKYENVKDSSKVISSNLMKQISDKLKAKSASCCNILEKEHEKQWDNQYHPEWMKQFVLKKRIKIQELFPLKQIPLQELENNWQSLQTQESELLLTSFNHQEQNIKYFDQKDDIVKQECSNVNGITSSICRYTIDLAEL